MLLAHEHREVSFLRITHAYRSHHLASRLNILHYTVYIAYSILYHIIQTNIDRKIVDAFAKIKRKLILMPRVRAHRFCCHLLTDAIVEPQTPSVRNN